MGNCERGRCTEQRRLDWTHFCTSNTENEMDKAATSERSGGGGGMSACIHHLSPEVLAKNRAWRVHTLMTPEVEGRFCRRRVLGARSCYCTSHQINEHFWCLTYEAQHLFVFSLKEWIARNVWQTFVSRSIPHLHWSGQEAWLLQASKTISSRPRSSYITGSRAHGPNALDLVQHDHQKLVPCRVCDGQSSN